jgi:hypothetical protein
MAQQYNIVVVNRKRKKRSNEENKEVECEPRPERTKRARKEIARMLLSKMHASKVRKMFYIADGPSTGGMPPFKRSILHVHREWDTRKLKTEKVPTLPEQVQSVDNMLVNCTESTIVRMVNTVYNEGKNCNSWVPRKEFIKRFGLCDEHRRYNLYNNALIFGDHAKPRVSIGRSQSIDFRSDLDGKNPECRVNPIYLSRLNKMMVLKAGGGREKTASQKD